MKKFLTYSFIAIFAIVTVCSFLVYADGASVGASTFEASGGTVNSDGTVTLDSNTNKSASIELTRDITAVAEELLGKNGGRLAVTCNYIIGYTGSEKVNAECTLKVNDTMHAGSNASFAITEADMKGTVTLTVRIYSIDATKVESFKITGVSFAGTPSADESPSPSASASASASANPSSTATPTASATATPTPTKAPSITYDKVDDNYDDSSKVTNPPPSIVGDIDLDEVATPVPEQTAVPNDTQTIAEKASTDPTTGLIILFAALILLLAADVAVIIWRKKLGFALLINGGVAHRRVRDDLKEEPVYDFLRDDDDFETNDSSPVTENEFTPAPTLEDDGYADDGNEADEPESFDAGTDSADDSDDEY